MKRSEAIENGPHEYSLRACLKVQNGSHTSAKWSNKIGGLWKLGSFDINALLVEIDRVVEQYTLGEIVEIKGYVKSTANRSTR